MLEFSIGYTIYNRQDLIKPILEGITNSFPESTEVIMHFDACTDQSIQQFQKHKHILGDREVIVLKTKRDLFELKSNNLLIQTFTRNILAIFQSDMVCSDPSICDRATEIIEHLGSSLGLLGARDGFELDGEKRISFVKNKWSPSTTEGHILREDEYIRRSFVNRGPIFLTRYVLKLLGGFDEAFYPGCYDDRDFCCRAKYDYGLRNVVMYSQMVEDRSQTTSKLDDSLLYSLNREVFWRKWGNHLDFSPRLGFGTRLMNRFGFSQSLRRMLVSKNILTKFIGKQ